MSRYKKSEYRAERRGALKADRQQLTRCEGNMGLCRSKDVAPCPRCGKPFCSADAAFHKDRCRGMG